MAVPALRKGGQQVADQQRVLITGGASGIGRAMAEAFVADGARVYVADVAGDPPDGCDLSILDVSDADAVDGLFDDVAATMGARASEATTGSGERAATKRDAT
jgi:NAD(P)-dependent dehydrogenase (short-subunit alcohol dehydrogenase family)